MSRTLIDALSVEHDDNFIQTLTGILDDLNAIEALDGSRVPKVHKEKIIEILNTVLFDYYYKENREDEYRKPVHIRLNEELVANILSDTSKLESPAPANRVGYNPLQDMEYAYGHCNICPAKAFICKNLGKSELGKEVGKKQKIESPDTSEYSEYDASISPSGGMTGKGSGDHSCNECQEYMSQWFNEKVTENSDYLWGLGGTGMLCRFGSRDGVDILDILGGKERPRMNGYDITDSDSEQIYNALLGMYLASRLGFDNYWIGCKIREPRDVVFEIDVLMINYSRNLLVCIENTTEREIKRGKLRNKKRVADQLTHLSGNYGYESLYLYLTPGSISELSDNSIEKSLYQNEDHIAVVGRDRGESRKIKPEEAVNTPPSEFESEFRSQCKSWIDQSEFYIKHLIQEDARYGSGAIPK